MASRQQNSRAVYGMLRKSKPQQPESIPPVAMSSMASGQDAKEGFKMSRFGLLEMLDAKVPGAEDLLEDLHQIWDDWKGPDSHGMGAGKPDTDAEAILEDTNENTEE